jgi:hypothetical protein
MQHRDDAGPERLLRTLFKPKSPRRNRLVDRLEAEFAEFYLQERCPGSPSNPRRVFRLGLKVYREYQHRVGIYHWLACVYDVLVFHHGMPRNGRLRRGLFRAFDPSKYQHGRLEIEDHFLHMFARRLRAELNDSLSPRGDLGHRDRWRKFEPEPELGLHVVRQRPRLGQWSDDFLSLVPWALESLELRPFIVIWSRYWLGMSWRETAKELRVDHHAAIRLHEVALNELRKYFWPYVVERLGLAG